MDALGRGTGEMNNDGRPAGDDKTQRCAACVRRERARARLREHFRTAYQDAEATSAEIRSGRYQPRVLKQYHPGGRMSFTVEHATLPREPRIGSD